MHENKVALVTGANKGIGHAIASALAARGLTVLVGARDAARGEAAARGIAGDARACPLDVTCADSTAAAVSRIQREFGRLDVLVNNAGIATFGTASTTRLDDVRAVFETNVFGVITVTQAMLPLLRAAPAGRIVNVSTASARSPPSQTPPSRCAASGVSPTAPRRVRSTLSQWHSPRSSLTRTSRSTQRAPDTPRPT